MAAESKLLGWHPCGSISGLVLLWTPELKGCVFVCLTNNWSRKWMKAGREISPCSLWSHQYTFYLFNTWAKFSLFLNERLFATESMTWSLRVDTCFYCQTPKNPEQLTARWHVCLSCMHTQFTEFFSPDIKYCSGVSHWHPAVNVSRFPSEEWQSHLEQWRAEQMIHKWIM